MIASELLNKIALLSPGTKLRKALDDIMAANLGALILFVDDLSKHKNIIQGGFEVNCTFTPERLYELSKMDGAIIVSQDVSKILIANAHLVPDPNIPTGETGTRHRTAERVARQTNCMVVAISKRRNVVTVYYGPHKYVLSDTRLLMARVSQALNAMEKYRLNLDKLLSHIDSVFDAGVSIYDVARTIEKAIRMMRIYEEIYPFIVELGEEASLIWAQLEEVLSDVEETTMLLIMDYSTADVDPDKAAEMIERLKQERNLTEMKIIRELGLDVQTVAQAGETVVYPKGYRFLKETVKIPLNVSQNLVKTFKNLKNLGEADVEELKSVDGIGEKRALAIVSNLGMIKRREKTQIGKKPE
ncbi:DNA integrity scanning protein DisA [Pseudothermotoga hypogea DSM 11164 = NBRC 106472]|uniref:DNA integrity scanning protein DisA n=2 Tax=Pseudothermotoga hypogea TaxID=57487 RepID=A0A0X1KTA8_9THEM|nr:MULTISPECIES: DNA integrity scanning diadenylate cyclase DisA [Pseudothermotoga]AJC74514.1 DNA integrity scanning protein DisA [Pseudothermotoga hypogea DSM 11164 = NBRC 106472]MBC7122906.1 DNA integrity scanning protein DisA [Pseudothermotoga sp.]MDI6862760.1 DNA integrity scanning diadenylate cyclase DisA [Pseudothermotoga sp.]